MEKISTEDRALLAAPAPLLRTERLTGGRIMQYRAAGPTSGEVVFLLHGLGAHSAEWRTVFAALSNRFRVIAWDAPGFGGSTPLSPDAPGANDYAEVLLELATALGASRFHLVGSSWGAAIAMAAAARASDRVAKLVLMVPNLCLAGLPQQAREDAVAMFMAPGFVLEADPAAFAAMLVAPDTPEPVLALVRTLKEQTTEQGYRQAVRMMERTDALAIAPKIAQDTLLLTGEADRLAPAAQHAAPIAAAMPRARLESIPGAGHLLELEAPHATVAHIRRHLIDGAGQ